MRVMLVLCCMMASASAFVITPLATRRSPLAPRVATALPVMNIDPVDATAGGTAVAEPPAANATEIPAEPAIPQEEEKSGILKFAEKAAPVAAVAGAVFVIVTTLTPLFEEEEPPPAPPPVEVSKQKRKVGKNTPAPVAKVETKKEKEARIKAEKKAKEVAKKAGKKAKEAEKKAAKKAKEAAKKAAKKAKKAGAEPVVAEKSGTKKNKKAKATTPAATAPVVTASKDRPKAEGLLLAPEERAKRTAAETQEVAKFTEGATISATKKGPEGASVLVSALGLSALYGVSAATTLGAKSAKSTYFSGTKKSRSRR
jgi:histone H1/5